MRTGMLRSQRYQTVSAYERSRALQPQVKTTPSRKFDLPESGSGPLRRTLAIVLQADVSQSSDVVDHLAQARGRARSSTNALGQPESLALVRFFGVQARLTDADSVRNYCFKYRL
jgi:hypothetical protein